MRASRLYPFLLLAVLLIAGCGQDRSNPSSASSSSADTTTSTATTTPPASTKDESVRVLVLGNSIAAGLGLPDPGRQSFPARLQQKVDSLGWDVSVRNAGESGMTSAGGLQRIDWLLQQQVDVLILELGGNDGLRGVDPAATQANLTAIIDSTFSRYPKAHVVLAGMQIPPNLGPQYTQRFRELYPAIASEYDRVSLIPFVLEDVGGVDSLMQNDGIHPTVDGQRVVASNVWEILRPVLEQYQTQNAKPQPAS